MCVRVFVPDEMRSLDAEISAVVATAAGTAGMPSGICSVEARGIPYSAWMPLPLTITYNNIIIYVLVMTCSY